MKKSSMVGIIGIVFVLLSIPFRLFMLSLYQKITQFGITFEMKHVVIVGFLSSKVSSWSSNPKAVEELGASLLSNQTVNILSVLLKYVTPIMILMMIILVAVKRYDWSSVIGFIMVVPIFLMPLGIPTMKSQVYLGGYLLIIASVILLIAHYVKKREKYVIQG